MTKKFKTARKEVTHHLAPKMTISFTPAPNRTWDVVPVGAPWSRLRPVAEGVSLTEAKRILAAWTKAIEAGSFAPVRRAKLEHTIATVLSGTIEQHDGPTAAWIINRGERRKYIELVDQRGGEVLLSMDEWSYDHKKYPANRRAYSYLISWAETPGAGVVIKRVPAGTETVADAHVERAVATWRWVKPKPAALTVFGKPMCVQCDATTRVLDKADVAYVYVDMAENPAALMDVQLLGYQAAPVVITPGGRKHWAGFQPDKLAPFVEARLAEVAEQEARKAAAEARRALAA